LKKIILLFSLVFASTLVLAQHKTLTLYYPNDSTNVISISNLDSMAVFICGASKVNYGGKYYNTVLIGNQCWLKENLDVGTMITGDLNQTDNSTLEKYCYNNVPSNCTTYGGLYQWNETMQYVTNEGAKGICPTGWHIPTLAEFQTLTTTVGNDGNALKAIGQGSGSGAGTNTSGFSALLAGDRSFNGYFYNLDYGYFWSSTEFSASTAYFLYLYYSDSVIYLIVDRKDYGFSVRCLKD